MFLKIVSYYYDLNLFSGLHYHMQIIQINKYLSLREGFNSSLTFKCVIVCFQSSDCGTDASFCVLLGGTTQDEPILVSRVAPNTPADKCTPRLSEGDQLLQINNNDVLQRFHAEVVSIIQQARSTDSGKYFLNTAFSCN